jgi:HD-GYP domain-containing protein (c-di-GMP phosphodiesterase class II)/DNA-binding CsgD family transcriptional regulator
MEVSAQRARTTLRRPELLASLSLAIDVGLGQPMEHMLRSCLIALGLAEAIGLEQDRRTVVYYADLVSWIGCHADSHELAQVFGDDISFRSELDYARDRTDPAWRRTLLGHVGRGSSVTDRGLMLGLFLLSGEAPVSQLIQSHCQSAGLFAERLGLSPEVRRVLPQAFERWDGRGLPAGLQQEEVAIEMRIVHLADIVEVHHRLGGLEGAVAVARQRRGTKFDPALVDAFCSMAPDLLKALEADDVWHAVVEAAPDDAPELSPQELDGSLEAMADFVDVKSPHTPGHSRGVAALAAGAAARLGMPTDEVEELRRAGLVHDLGRMGVTNLIWDKAGPLTPADWERVRLHPYLSERMLSRPGTLRRLGELAGRHHERLDGSGYPHGLVGSALTPSMRLLAAADVYHAMREHRAHRNALSSEAAAAQLRDEARQGRLDSAAVEAVLGEGGHRMSRRVMWPRGLTAREVEILGLVAAGAGNREIARHLHISEKTLRNHLEHIYSKLEVSNRTGAVLFAIEHGLTGHFPHSAAVP